MPGKLTITVGIPGSGKTHEATLIMHNEGRDKVELVSRDDLRHLLFRSEGICTPAQESKITDIETMIVKDGLRAGKHVVVHDTNLKAQYRTRWARIARNLGAEFVIKSMTHVSLDDCYRNNRRRGDAGGRYVPEEVIKTMHRKFIEPLKGQDVVYPPVHADYVIFKPYVARPELPRAIIADIDGTTLTHEGVRSPYDASRYQYDLPRPEVVKFIREQHYELGKQIVFCSGRLDIYREVTEESLNKHVKVPFHLVMREDPQRDDSVEKYLLFDRYIRNYYNAELVLDDRDRVVNMWRMINLPCWQVQKGDF